MVYFKLFFSVIASAKDVAVLLPTVHGQCAQVPAMEAQELEHVPAHRKWQVSSVKPTHNLKPAAL